jgi:hypothetical protein
MMEKAYIELTEAQKQKLIPIMDELMQSNQRGKPCLVLAQIHFDGWDAVAVVKTVSYNKAQRLAEVVKPGSAGKLTNSKMVMNRLAKARADR